MNFDTTGHILWPYDKPNRYNDDCDSCYKELKDEEQDDPCIIDGRKLCDKCASDLSYLRNMQFLKTAAERTRNLLPNELKLKTTKSTKHESNRIL